MNAYLPHERLDVYTEALSFVRGIQPLVDAWPAYSVRDQTDRASESIITNLARAARRRRTNQGVYYIECSLGSVLECAACLDVAFVNGLIEKPELHEKKQGLQKIAKMEVGLRSSWRAAVHEESETYSTATEIYFSHESLKVYQNALKICRLLKTSVPAEGNRRHRFARRVDETATSLVLNIAEGNGRFSKLDHGKFIDQAEDAGIMLAAYLDLVACDFADNAEPAKVLLREVAAMLAGLKGYLHEEGDGNGKV